jgi:hypothetical protein
VAVGVGVGVGVKPGVGVSVGEGVPVLFTMRLGEMTQPVRVITSVAPAR